jgi:MoaA/NifB/PqqE/SkfB family radical SAM enzyme
MKMNYEQYLIHLGGGSFFCHPEYAKILHFNERIKANINIDLPIHENFIEYIIKYPPNKFNYTFSISLWGIGESHNTLTGIDSYDNLDKFIFYAKKYQNNVNLSFVMTKELLLEQKKVVEFLLSNEKIDKVYFHRLMPSGRCKKENLPIVDDIEKFYKYIINLGINSKVKFHHTISTGQCVSYSNRLFINYDGNVFGCGWINSKSISIGNISKNEFKDIFADIHPCYEGCYILK